MLSDKVIRREDGLIGRLTEWADNHQSALVRWDGWMGTTWVKETEMIVVQDLVMEALNWKRNTEYGQLLERLDHIRDDEVETDRDVKYHSARLTAIDIAIAAAKPEVK